MKENVKLRRVTFTMEIPGAAMLDIINSDNPEDQTKVRKGYFHTFGNVLRWDSENSKYLEEMLAIVEEEESGKVYHVLPQNMTFVD